ncbi:MAG: twin-arginine translocation signal domain-containing protein, partial [Puniceicoccales bacterium]|nr:twin-arginine translocation signal domain-containing protein [Puniceicoccales bacterium]
MTNHSPSATAAGAGAAAGIAISRRQFLKTAAGSIAGSAFVFPALVPASALGREAGVPAPSN